MMAVFIVLVIIIALICAMTIGPRMPELVMEGVLFLGNQPAETLAIFILIIVAIYVLMKRVLTILKKKKKKKK